MCLSEQLSALRLTAALKNSLISQDVTSGHTSVTGEKLLQMGAVMSSTGYHSNSISVSASKFHHSAHHSSVTLQKLAQGYVCP